MQVSSAGYNGGNLAKITIDGVPVRCEKNSQGHYRGLHIVIINPANGEVALAKVFDTYKYSKAFDDFIAGGIPELYIVIAACKDDCTKNLSWNGRKWFQGLGSKEIMNLQYR